METYRRKKYNYSYQTISRIMKKGKENEGKYTRKRAARSTKNIRLVRTILDENNNTCCEIIVWFSQKYIAIGHKRVTSATYLTKKYGITRNAKCYKWDKVINTDFPPLVKCIRKLNPQNDGIWVDTDVNVKGESVKIIT